MIAESPAEQDRNKTQNIGSKAHLDLLVTTTCIWRIPTTMFYRMISLARGRFSYYYVLTPLAAHNDKEKPLSSNSLLLNGAYLNI